MNVENQGSRWGSMSYLFRRQQPTTNIEQPADTLTPEQQEEQEYVKILKEGALEKLTDLLEKKAKLLVDHKENLKLPIKRSSLKLLVNLFK